MGNAREGKISLFISGMNSGHSNTLWYDPSHLTLYIASFHLDLSAMPF